MSRPLLVTGLPRSGTTFVGKVLAQPKQIFNIGEPFLHCVGADHLYPYYRTENRKGVRYDDLLQSILEYEKILQYRVNKWEWSLGGLRRRILGSRSTLEYIRAWWANRIQGQNGRLLLKEPHGLLLTFSAVRDLDCQVIVLVRHPAGQVSSYLSLGWEGCHNRPGSLLDQSKLIEDHLEWLPAALSGTERALVEELGLMWRALYDVFLDYLDEIGDADELRVVRHEDICRDPLGSFSELYEWADLPWTRTVEDTISRLTNAKNPVDHSGSQAHPHDHHRDSAALVDIWKHRLSSDQIQCLRDVTCPVSSHFYDRSDW